MLEVTESGTDVYIVGLDETEAEFLAKHAEVWGLSKEQAVADLFDYAIASIPDDKVPESYAALFADSTDGSNVALTVGWPTEGSFASATGEDRRFVAAWLECKLKEALLVVNYKHH
jgi:hypothetical protein